MKTDNGIGGAWAHTFRPRQISTRGRNVQSIAMKLDTTAKRKKRQGGSNAASGRKDYITTTELAKLCGVSRFTVINWANQGKINAVKTLGGHRRISVAEAISFLERFHQDTSHGDRSSIASGTLGHCWEYRHKADHGHEDSDCRNCLIHGGQIEYCFVMVRQFGKEVIRCKGDCLSCAYFEKLFRSYDANAQPKAAIEGETPSNSDGRRNFRDSFAYSVGKGVRDLRKRVTRIRDRFAGRSPGTSGKPHKGSPQVESERQG